jgi:DNA-binding NtrC family response regulator
MQKVPRIFVVDNEPIIASTTAIILNRNGYSARGFTDPREVVSASQFDVPDLLLTDVVMFGLTGIDLAIQVTAQHPNCKVLLFSGKRETERLLEAAQAKGYNFPLLAKPVHPSELLDEIAKLSQDPEAERQETGREL